MSLLEKLLSKIRPEHIHEEVDWGVDVGKEILERYKSRKVDEFIPAKEMKDRCPDETKYEWSLNGKTCPECGDRMWYNRYWEKWLCRSWIYMEGGCYTEGDW